MYFRRQRIRAIVEVKNQVNEVLVRLGGGITENNPFLRTYDVSGGKDDALVLAENFSILQSMGRNLKFGRSDGYLEYISSLQAFSRFDFGKYSETTARMERIDSRIERHFYMAIKDVSDAVLRTFRQQMGEDLNHLMLRASEIDVINNAGYHGALLGYVRSTSALMSQFSREVAASFAFDANSRGEVASFQPELSGLRENRGIALAEIAETILNRFGRRGLDLFLQQLNDQGGNSLDAMRMAQIWQLPNRPSQYTTMTEMFMSLNRLGGGGLSFKVAKHHMTLGYYNKEYIFYAPGLGRLVHDNIGDMVGSMERIIGANYLDEEGAKRLGLGENIFEVKVGNNSGFMTRRLFMVDETLSEVVERGIRDYLTDSIISPELLTGNIVKSSRAGAPLLASQSRPKLPTIAEEPTKDLEESATARYERTGMPVLDYRDFNAHTTPSLKEWVFIMGWLLQQDARSSDTKSIVDMASNDDLALIVKRFRESYLYYVSMTNTQPLSGSGEDFFDDDDHLKELAEALFTSANMRAAIYNDMTPNDWWETGWSDNAETMKLYLLNKTLVITPHATGIRNVEPQSQLFFSLKPQALARFYQHLGEQVNTESFSQLVHSIRIDALSNYEENDIPIKVYLKGRGYQSASAAVELLTHNFVSDDFYATRLPIMVPLSTGIHYAELSPNIYSTIEVEKGAVAPQKLSDVDYIDVLSWAFAQGIENHVSSRNVADTKIYIEYDTALSGYRVKDDFYGMVMDVLDYLRHSGYNQQNIAFYDTPQLDQAQNAIQFQRNYRFFNEERLLISDDSDSDSDSDDRLALAFRYFLDSYSSKAAEVGATSEEGSADFWDQTQASINEAEKQLGYLLDSPLFANDDALIMLAAKKVSQIDTLKKQLGQEAILAFAPQEEEDVFAPNLLAGCGHCLAHSRVVAAALSVERRRGLSTLCHKPRKLWHQVMLAMEALLQSIARMQEDAGGGRSGHTGRNTISRDLYHSG